MPLLLLTPPPPTSLPFPGCIPCESHAKHMPSGKDLLKLVSIFSRTYISCTCKCSLLHPHFPPCQLIAAPLGTMHLRWTLSKQLTDFTPSFLVLGSFHFLFRESEGLILNKSDARKSGTFFEEKVIPPNPLVKPTIVNILRGWGGGG